MSAKITIYLQGEEEKFILDWIDPEISDDIAAEMNLSCYHEEDDIHDLKSAINSLINEQKSTLETYTTDAKRLSNLLTQCTTEIAYNKIAVELDSALDMVDYAQANIEKYIHILNKISVFEDIVSYNHEITGKVAKLSYNYF